MINNHLLAEHVKAQFQQNVKFLKFTVPTVIKGLSGLAIENAKLKNAATRIQVPKPFDFFIKCVEKRMKSKFPSNLEFTKDEVIKSDVEVIHTFSESNFYYKELNLDLLIQSAIQSSLDLGILKVDQTKHNVISIDSSLQSFEKGTSSGYPIFKKKGTEEASKDAKSWVKTFIKDPKLSEILKQPTAVFHRFQYKVGKNFNDIIKKIRAIWGISFRVLVLEGCFFKEMISYCTLKQQESENPSASWGLTKQQISQKIVSKARLHKNNIYSVDVKQFDSNVASFMWCLFFAICKFAINFDEIFSEKVFNSLLAFHNYTPYCYQSTKLRFQYKGVPSGSTITSLFNTFVSRTVINYAFLEYTNGKFTADNLSCCLGDDNLIVLKGISEAHILSVYRRFGLPVSKEKSSVTRYDKPFQFLGYIWDTENRPTQTMPWYIAHICLPSRFIQEKDIPISLLQTYRALSICMGLYEGMKYFDYLVGWADKEYHNLLDMLHRGEDPFIRYVGEDQRITLIGIPLSIILSQDGWKYF